MDRDFTPANRKPLENALRNLVPENELERAILNREYACAVQHVVGSCQLERPELLATQEFFDAPIAVAMLVVQLAMSKKLRKQALGFLRDRYPESEVIYLLREAAEKPECICSDAEKQLLAAVEARDNAEVIRLIREEAVSLRHVPEELYFQLSGLEKRTIFLLFYEGIDYRAKALALQFLHDECEQPDKLNALGYKRILMYANLLIHILQEEMTPEDEEWIIEEWYPMGGTIVDGYDPGKPCHSYSYYYDPQFLYRPAPSQEEYEKPVHDID